MVKSLEAVLRSKDTALNSYSRHIPSSYQKVNRFKCSLASFTVLQNALFSLENSWYCQKGTFTPSAIQIMTQNMRGYGNGQIGT